MAVYFRPDSIAGQNQSDQEDKDKVTDLDKAIAQANAAADNANAAARRMESAIAQAEAAARTAEGAAGRVGQSIEDSEKFCEDKEVELTTSENGRVQAEQTRVTQEAERESAETERNKQQAANNTQQAKNNADQAANNLAAMGLPPIELSEEDLDPETRIPTIEGEYGRLYFAPSANPVENDLAVEWVVKPPAQEGAPRRWERVGSSEVTLPPMIDTDQIDTLFDGGDLSGKGFLSETGLSYYNAKADERMRIYVAEGKSGSAGSADVAAKLGTNTVGSATEPIYLNQGVPTAIPKVGAASKADNATNAETASKLGTETVGSATQPVYLLKGVATAIAKVGAATSADSAAKATNADVAAKLGTNTVGSATVPIYLLNGVPTAGTAPVIPVVGTVGKLNTNGNTSQWLRGDGTWVAPPNTTYPVVSKTAAGLCPKLPSDAMATSLYLDETTQWSDPLREV